jgi:hypothetical protein
MDYPMSAAFIIDLQSKLAFWTPDFLHGESHIRALPMKMESPRAFEACLEKGVERCVYPCRHRLNG